MGTLVLFSVIRANLTLTYMRDSIGMERGGRWLLLALADPQFHAFTSSKPPSEVAQRKFVYKNPSWSLLSELLGNPDCVIDGSIQLTDPTKKFLTPCFISLFGLLWALVFIGPFVRRLYTLRTLEGGNRTLAGQLATVLAVFAPMLVFLNHTLSVSFIPPSDLVILGTSVIAAVLHWMQDGRVIVSCDELLLFWLGMAPVYLGWAVNAFLSSPSWLLGMAAIAALAIFPLEYTNTERKPQNQFDDFSLFEVVTSRYASPILDKEKITVHDLPEIPRDMEALASAELFESSLYTRMNGKSPSQSKTGSYKVLFSILGISSKSLSSGIIASLVGMLVELSVPYLVKLFLQNMDSYRQGVAPLYPCYYVAILFLIFPLGYAAIDALVYMYWSMCDRRTRAAVLVATYRKSFNLSPKARELYKTSDILNLMSVDTTQIASLMGILCMSFAFPLFLLAAGFQLWRTVGSPIFGAMFVYAFLGPALSSLVMNIGAVYEQRMRVLDERTKLTSNLFKSIKSVKLYAWEIPFASRISEVRVKELALLRIAGRINTLISTATQFSSEYVAMAIFICFLYFRRGTLSPEVIFPSLLLLNYVAMSLVELPRLFTQGRNGLVSCGRLYDFMSQPTDRKQNFVHNLAGVQGFDEPAVDVEGITSSWNGENEEAKIALVDVTLRAGRGDLVCIVGRVGSGKTALLRSLSGDLSIIKGSVTLNGSLSYGAQDPWLQNMSFRENILFGQVLDEVWYEKVLDACELLKDVESMPDGHDTNVGERGISLSGGQKARVALARAVYSRSDIIFLDDVLSAVDEHVSAALITKLLSVDGLLANRTVILATNNIKVLSYSSQIIALKEKEVAEVSSFSEVVINKEKSLIFQLVQEFGHAEDLNKAHDHFGKRIEAAKNRKRLEPTTSEKPAQFAEFDVYAKHSDEEEEKIVHSLDPFWRYFFLSRPWFTWFALVILIIALLFRNIVIAYLGVIASHDFTSLFDARYHFIAYFSIITLAAILAFANLYFVTVPISLGNAQILHDKMLWSTMRAPMTFFDINSLGRLINRFTGDLGSMDAFAQAGSVVLRAFLNILLTLIPIIMGAPQLLILLIPLVWYANSTRRSYVPAQRKITRISASANSPILAHAEDSLKGQMTVRAFNQKERFEDSFVDYVNYWSKAAFFRDTFTQWLNLRIHLTTVLLTFGAAMGMTQLAGWGIIGASYAGVILNFCERCGQMIGVFISRLAHTEVQGVSLERVLEYIDMKNEAAYRIEATQPSEAWPQSGRVSFDNLAVRYNSDGPEVLRNLSLSINRGEKIGVVGRTGSGKSTLTMAIFRMIEASKGNIEIDGIDTRTLGLADLRSRLSIVPQDSQIFDASVRVNLDPLHTVDDARLWEILELCHLKSHFQKYQGLDTELIDSGSELSRGQAQLLCLGRALVHNGRVLVLDEATASVDHQTDKIVQETIRKNLSDRTIITIAHRLNTIIDSDRILVLDNGEIREFDTPHALLESRGLFYSLFTAEKKESVK